MASSSMKFLSLAPPPPPPQALSTCHQHHTSFTSVPRLALTFPSIATSYSLQQPITTKLARNVAVSSDVEVDDEEADSDLALSGEEKSDSEELSFSPDLKVFVRNLSFSVDSAALAELFEEAGNVEMVEVIYDKDSGRSRGYGSVTMSTAEESAAAVERFNGYELQGRRLRVSSARPQKRESSPFRGGSRGGGSSSDGPHRVFVGNLDWGVDNVALEALFSEQGDVKDAWVVYDRESGRSRGFGFVTYGSAEEVAGAI